MNDSNIAILGAIIGLVGAIIGSHLTNRTSIKLYEKQQAKELRNIAKSMDISFEEVCKPGNLGKLVELYKSEKQSNIKSKSYPMFPLYSQDDIYFVFKQDISKFEYCLSARIYQFFNDLIKAEMFRLYIVNNFMVEDLQPVCEIYLEEMKAKMISCYDNVPEIRLQLKEIYEEYEEYKTYAVDVQNQVL